MIQNQVTVEIYTADEDRPQLRWEYAADENESVFLVLGKAFEVAQGNAMPSFPEALQAFFRGAMIQKEDVVEMLSQWKE